MTINELILELESIISGNPHMENYEVRISAETADYGGIRSIEAPQDGKMIVFYKKKGKPKMYPFKRENYIYLRADY